MNWQCRLYGHQWRHPGVYEVVLVGENRAYPFQCAVCETEMVLDASGTRKTELSELERSALEPGLERTPDE